MSEASNQDSGSGRSRRLTERQVIEELGLDRMELYLAATAERLGRHDAISHLLVFSEEEVDALAARLGIARRKRPGPSTGIDLGRVPEPSSE